jgi:tRNA pseudouridine55 synthase
LRFAFYAWKKLFSKGKNTPTLKMKSGFLLINKPKGQSSHNVVSFLRKITKIKKIGHSGTLDPFATGLLILGIKREATKRLSQFLKMDKEYKACLKLGAESNTFDREGKIVRKKINEIPKIKEIKNVLKKFIGEINQVPPIFSAKKIRGKRLYQLARKGKKVRLKPQKVKIYQISILDYKFPFLKIKVKCSAGTYIRSLASDIGKALKCGAYLENLKRTKIGNFSLKDSIELSKLNSKNWQKFLIQIK